MSTSALIALLAATTGCPDSPAQPHSPPQPQLRALSLQQAGAGTGSLNATPAGPAYGDGTTVSIAAVAATGSVFTGWTGDCVGSTNPCAIVMSADRSVTATFRAATGIGQFDGAYTGTWSGGQSDGRNLTGPLTLTVVNGVVTGDAAPISGSARAISGTVSATGEISALLPPNHGCGVTLAGQVITTGSGAATGSGTYRLIARADCNVNSGTWIVTRTS